MTVETRREIGEEGPGPSASAAVRLEGVTKRFGDVAAVAGIDLEIHDGEFFSMLGPSGSGKTTTLRMIAGFEEPDRRAGSGCSGRDITGVPPFDRDVNTVFQDYALFPHMSVADNVGYGLARPQGRCRRAATASMPKRFRWCASTTTVRGVPRQLSGGQRQRVALARALINRPPRPAAGRAARRTRPQAARGDADRAARRSSSRSASRSSTSPTTRRRRSR